MPAVRTAEHPPGGLGDPAGAGRAGSRGAALVGQRDSDPGGLGLVTQHGHQVSQPPVPGPLVVPPPRGQAQYPPRVADRQCADPVPHRPADHHLGGLMLGLPDPPSMPRLDHPLPAAVLPPSPRGTPPRHRGAARRGPAPVLGITQVLAGLRADRPTGHQQLPVRPGGSVWVDDAQIHPGHPARVRCLAVRIRSDSDLRGHIHLQPSGLIQQGDRTDLTRRVGQVPVKLHRQRRAAPRHRQPQRPAIQPERAVIPAQRHQAAASPREPRRRISRLTALGCGEPRVAVAAQHRPCPGRVQLAERARSGCSQFPAQRGVPGQRRVLATAAPRVDLQHAAPHVAGRDQQPDEAAALTARGAQPAPRGAVHRARRIQATFPWHRATMPPPTDISRSCPAPAHPERGESFRRTIQHRSYGHRH
jgi:hypothetical protein